MDRIGFGKSVEAHRIKLGLTQGEFGERYGGVSQQSVASWEAGSIPAVKTLILLCADMGIDYAEVAKLKRVPAKRESLEQAGVMSATGNILSPLSTISGEMATKPPKEEINEQELMENTLYVLRSDTVYKAALAANIRAFYHGTKRDEDMQNWEKMMVTMQMKHDADMEELKSLIRKDGEDGKKREASNSH